MSAGQLRDFVTIKQPADNASSNGDNSSPTWSNLDQVWADIKPLSASEKSDSRDVSSNKFKIKIYWRDDVTTKMRVYEGSDAYKITGLMDETRKKQYLWLICEVHGR